LRPHVRARRLADVRLSEAGGKPQGRTHNGGEPAWLALMPTWSSGGGGDPA
jgi:hypothetical protein